MRSLHRVSGAALATEANGEGVMVLLKKCHQEVHVLKSWSLPPVDLLRGDWVMRMLSSSRDNPSMS